ncbi:MULTISPECIES: NAD(P)-dependent oxidoreductase [Acidovorax]|uniref:NAD(P)-dependent oxidoreductase n=1 Tax=Acidovorax facilis TaxID=12917 RepID=A0ABV8DGQ3_9BURK|nr:MULTISPECIES: NAD(P)-dependent oxidoreductase [Acidovorax]KQB55774.1 2-hydroxy-3-oxopropionate reductase [Acidovorax sp. SD340]MBO1008858.1 NAD(P)-dependent oxidoreductase [Acidovorax sp. SD340]MCO4242677.1 NAD(P)-dependent oxidoreductase [Acidovorax facilis]
MTTTPLRIAVLGIGMMGRPIARRLKEAGHQVQVWNRTRAKAEPLAAFGITVHASPTEAVQNADMVISLLENGPVVGHVLFESGTAKAMRKGALFIDMASIQPREARDHAARLGEMGLAHLDAPVSGGTVGAENGTLAILVGGRPEDFAQAQPVFAACGRATHVGPHGAGQLTKLANQMIVGITIGAVAEALLFAAKGGADMAKVREAIQGGFADSRILQLHGQRMVERDFAPRGRMAVQLKDMRNALATAGEIGFDAPITALFETLYAEGVDHGLGELDHSGLFVELASRNAMQ